VHVYVNPIKSARFRKLYPRAPDGGTYHNSKDQMLGSDCGFNVEVTGPKLTAVFDSRGGPRSEATTGARRTNIAVNLWSGAAIR
jgi:hypothetical protein